MEILISCAEGVDTLETILPVSVLTATGTNVKFQKWLSLEKVKNAEVFYRKVPGT